MLIHEGIQADATSNLETRFELNDTLYARANIAPADTEEVYLWLGANVMLAYPIAEAEELLQEKLSAAQKTLSNCEEDQEFLREQITVCLAPVPLKISILTMLIDAGGRNGSCV